MNWYRNESIPVLVCIRKEVLNKYEQKFTILCS